MKLILKNIDEMIIEIDDMKHDNEYIGLVKKITPKK